MIKSSWFYVKFKYNEKVGTAAAGVPSLHSDKSTVVFVECMYYILLYYLINDAELRIIFLDYFPMGYTGCDVLHYRLVCGYVRNLYNKTENVCPFLAVLDA